MTRRLLVLLTSGTLCWAALGCGDDTTTRPAGDGGAGAEAGAPGAGGSGGGTLHEYVVLVRGELFTDDMQEAKGVHDALAAGGEEAAKAAGDFGHDALLGTALLGTAEDTFLGLDRWNDLDGMSSFYANPDFAAAFGMLFASPPTVETFAHQPSWHGWGDLTAGDTSNPYFFVVVRGRLAAADPDAAKSAHDAVASGGQAQAEAAGDVAHVVFTGLDDPRELLAIDIWRDTTNLEALYTNPDFVAAFGALFEEPPTLGVYQSTDWHQW